MDDAMAERARIVAWLRDFPSDLYGHHWATRFADAIERGDHDTIAIPRLSGDQKGAK